MNITVFLKVLSEGEFLWTLGAGESALFDVSGQVAAEGEPGGVLLVAGLSVTKIGLGNCHFECFRSDL